MKTVVLYGDLFREFLKINSEKLTLTGLHKMIFDSIMTNTPITELSDLITFFSDYTAMLKHLMFRRYSGAGNDPGLLDALKKSATTFVFQHRDKFVKNYDGYDLIITPLETNSDERLYEIARKNNTATFPVIHAKMESKYITRKLFTGMVLPFLMINTREKIEINPQWDTAIFGNHVIFKDDMGFGSGKDIPYQITTIENIGNILEKYWGRDLDFIIEPFLYVTDNDKFISNLLKIHVYNEVLESEVLTYKYTFKSITGSLGDDTIESIEEGVSNNLPDDFSTDIVNNLVTKYLPYHMVSLDFIQSKRDGKWYCIDINHSCSSWGEVQQKGGNTEFTIFDFMLEKIDNGNEIFGAYDKINEYITSI